MRHLPPRGVGWGCSRWPGARKNDARHAASLGGRFHAPTGEGGGRPRVRRAAVPVGDPLPGRDQGFAGAPAFAFAGMSSGPG
jgi:hypothetical protein